MTQKETEGLLHRIAQGDNDALYELYVEFKSTVFNFALSITGDYHFSQDVLQDTFVRIKTSSSVNKNYQNPKAYIFTITRNLSVSYLRKQKYIVGDKEFEMIRNNADTEDVLLSVELQRAINVLNEVEHQIVVLYVIGGLKHKEIAQILSIPTPTVMWKYRNSLAKLKNQLKLVNFDRSD